MASDIESGEYSEAVAELDKIKNPTVLLVLERVGLFISHNVGTPEDLCETCNAFIQWTSAEIRERCGNECEKLFVEQIQFTVQWMDRLIKERVEE